MFYTFAHAGAPAKYRDRIVSVGPTGPSRCVAERDPAHVLGPGLPTSRHGEGALTTAADTTAGAAAAGTIRTSVPGRLDRLPWSRWHWTIIIGSGTVWILDGLEVTIIGNIATRLGEPNTGLGGEDAAINSATDELIPSKHGGRVVVNENIFAPNGGRRVAVGLGVVLGLVIPLGRRNVPKRPRWLTIHGKHDEAEELVSDVEKTVERETGKELPKVDDEIEIKQPQTTGLVVILKTVFGTYPKRTVRGLSLFTGQVFLSNTVTFGDASILTTFFDVPSAATGYYYVVIAIGTFLAPLLLGPLFDTVGRPIMITSTYLGSGTPRFGTAWLFSGGHLSAVTMTICWTVVLFYSVGTTLGGITGPCAPEHDRARGDAVGHRDRFGQRRGGGARHAPVAGLARGRDGGRRGRAARAGRDIGGNRRAPTAPAPHSGGRHRRGQRRTQRVVRAVVQRREG